MGLTVYVGGTPFKVKLPPNLDPENAAIDLMGKSSVRSVFGDWVELEDGGHVRRDAIDAIVPQTPGRWTPA